MFCNVVCRFLSVRSPPPSLVLIFLLSMVSFWAEGGTKQAQQRDADGDAAMSSPRPQQLASSPPLEQQLSISRQPPRYSRHEALLSTGSGSENGIGPTANSSQEGRGSSVVSLAVRLMTLGRAISSMFTGNNNAGVIASPLGGDNASSSTAVAHGRVGSVVSVSIAISIGSVGGGGEPSRRCIG